jgi:hypothetical protein
MVGDLPADQVFRLTYEELCNDTSTAVRSAWVFLGLHDAATPAARSLSGMHHISGSPSKVDPTRQTIRQDKAHIGAFSPAQLDYLKSQAHPYAKKWGYN